MIGIRAPSILYVRPRMLKVSRLVGSLAARGWRMPGRAQGSPSSKGQGGALQEPVVRMRFQACPGTIVSRQKFPADSARHNRRATLDIVHHSAGVAKVVERDGSNGCVLNSGRSDTGFSQSLEKTTATQLTDRSCADQ